MWDSGAEAERWWSQADNDLEFAGMALREEYYHQACFIAQQAAEKSVKAVGYHLGDRSVLGHSVVTLVNRYRERVPTLAELRAEASVLDLYYLPSRYPNGLPGGAPFQVFTESQAREAVDAATAFVQAVRGLLDGATGSNP